MLRLARANLNMDEQAFRRVLSENDVKPATVTNWKGGRPIPVGRYDLLARLLHTTTDELHGRKRPSERAAAPGPDTEADALASGIREMSPEARKFLTAIIATLQDMEAPAPSAKASKR